MTLEEVSREAGLSPFHFSQTRRVARAVAMIESRQHTLAQVADATGFSSQAHMNRAFREVVGLTPGEVFRRAVVMLLAFFPLVDILLMEIPD